MNNLKFYVACAGLFIAIVERGIDSQIVGVVLILLGGILFIPVFSGRKTDSKKLKKGGGRNEEIKRIY